MQELPRRGLADVWGARYDDRIIAAGLFFHDDREMHFIAGGSVSGYGSLPTSYLLHWHAIAAAARSGLQVFNTEASGIPSIDAFKETFNPRLERRDTLIWARRPVRRAEASLRRWNKRIRSVGGRLRHPGGEDDVGRRAA
jgi:lipid II:glycine glycyltransferase (peptidoglycan interpeptide bridge formation enzyme)